MLKPPVVRDGIATAGRWTARGDARHPRYGRWLCGIVVLAVVVRAAIVICAEWRPARFDFPDSHRYVLVAQNIAAGRGPVESEAVRAGTDPLYPGILSVGVLLGCDTDGAVMLFGRIVNSLFGVATVALLAAFARRLVGDAAALAAAAILAVDPILLFFNALVLTETCYIALLLAGFYGVTRLGEPRGWLWAVTAGLFVGLATITRSGGLFLPLFLLPFVWWFARRGSAFPTFGRGGAHRGLRPQPECGTGVAPVNPPARSWCHRFLREMRRSQSLVVQVGPNGRSPTLGEDGARVAAPGGRNRWVVTACFLLATCAAFVPTVARNYGLFGRFVPVRIASGASLMEALGPWADGGPGMDRIEYPSFPPDADEYVRDRICRAAAVDWAWDHPGKALSLAWVKLRRTWSVTLHASDYSSPFYTLIAWNTVAPEYLLAACGVWLLRRHGGILGLLLIVAIYSTLVHMVFVGSVRYRVPAMPFLFVLAGVSIEALWRRRRRCWAG
ncbi:MAG: glycosyltransferase family 39 protein [Phycisphaerae bacterium]|nr:glycosyltransferase family 39 protein [Phycisphaerae bacterium]